MFAKSNGLFRSVFIAGAIVLFQGGTLAQSTVIRGIVRDEQSRAPIRDVNVSISGTGKGTSTDKTGSFTVKPGKTPVSLVFSCVGYITGYFEVKGNPDKTVEIFLEPRAYMLGEVDITARKYSYLFRDREYSVLDYEMLDGDILLLIFRNQLKRSELVLLNRTGDTLAVAKPPELPPASLYKDFLGNVHYFSKSRNAYQCYFDRSGNRLAYLYRTTVDSLLSSVRNFIFKQSGRLYFQENMANGFGTAFGYCAKGTGKKYIREFVDDHKMSEYADDLKFYAGWNNFIASTNIFPDPSFYAGKTFDEFEGRAQQGEFYNLTYPVIKTSSGELAFFNFARDEIELMDGDGIPAGSVAITFHKANGFSRKHPSGDMSNEGWRWGNRLLSDESTLEAYAVFLRGGYVKLRRIDPYTGKPGSGTVLPFLFPEKISIDQGEAYFLVKNDGVNSNWKLVKCRLE